MKLHIPVSLFAALMTVMTALPSFAGYSLTIDGQEVPDWEGNIIDADKAPRHSLITVDDGSELTLSKGAGRNDDNWFGNLDITVSGGASLTLPNTKSVGGKTVYGGFPLTNSNNWPETMVVSLTIEQGNVTIDSADFGSGLVNVPAPEIPSASKCYDKQLTVEGRLP